MNRNILFAVFITQSAIWGQSPDQVAPRGYQPTSGYAISEIESVNTVSGSLGYQIPLASLPPGKAGLTAGINLNYSSALWDTFLEYIPRPSDPSQYILSQNMLASSKGGWQYSFNASFEVADPRPSVPNPPNCINDPASWNRYRYNIVLPDGSTHSLHPKGYSESTDGYTSVELNSFTHHFCTPPAHSHHSI